MALEIVWTTRAERKFDSLLEYLLEEWGEQVTKNFARKVYSFLDLLSEFPSLGSLENEEMGIRGFTIVKQVNLFYTVKENQIILLNFFDNRQNPEKKRL
jgi:plasmid stabilization system protein ParE